MNWEAAGAIGELLGALAVVITLLYLATSVRQNTRIMSLSGLRDVTARWNHWSEMFASSSDLAEIVARGNIDFGSLSAAESLRYGAYVQSFFDNVESYLTLMIDHMLGKDLYGL